LKRTLVLRAMIASRPYYMGPGPTERPSRILRPIVPAGSGPRAGR
jgi:hypothetical protein